MLLKSPVKLSSASDRVEVEVLLCCATSQIDSETADRLRNLLQESINWAKLIQMANQHKVMPLLYWTLNSNASELVPKPILAQLRHEFHMQTRRSLLLSGELVRLLNLFETQGIPSLPFKGPVLAAAAYNNLSLRQFSDLDILVRCCDLEKAKALFLAEGYRMKIERIEVTPEQEEMFVRSPDIHKIVREAAYPFIHAQKGIVAELHWGIMPKYFSYPIDSEALWENLEFVSIANQKIPHCSPENTLLTLIGHGTKDCWKQLSRICDVAEFIRNRPQLNWTELIEQSTIKGGQRMLFLGLSLAHNLLGTSLPEEVWQKIKTEKEVDLLAKQCEQELFSESNHSFQDGSATRFHLSTRERLSDKIRYFLSIAIAPTTCDWLMLPLIKFPTFIYYLLRPIRLIKQQVSQKNS
jgi:Uncharacterised nucleotidyltransferase